MLFDRAMFDKPSFNFGPVPRSQPEGISVAKSAHGCWGWREENTLLARERITWVLQNRVLARGPTPDNFVSRGVGPLVHDAEAEIEPFWSS